MLVLVVTFLWNLKGMLEFGGYCLENSAHNTGDDGDGGGGSSSNSNSSSSNQ
jgi:hypothetical protein